MRTRLADFFVNKADVIDLMTVCMVAQEPLLLVGKPGTAKSDLDIKFCQAMNLGEGEYFEYMLTKFTEPSEIIGPVDIARLKEGAYFRRIESKLPTASVVFLDEIFKSNSAILNTLLTIINERKFYQDGRPEPVRMVMLFGATNEIPEFTELGALRDRFALKIKSDSVGDQDFDRLIEKGLRNETFRAFNQRPWQGLATLADFQQLHWRIAELLQQTLNEGGAEGRNDPFFPPAVYTLFRRILRTLIKEHGAVPSRIWWVRNSPIWKTPTPPSICSICVMSRGNCCSTCVTRA